MLSMLKTKLFREASLLAFMQLLNMIIPLLAYPVISRDLSIVDFGEFLLFVSFFNLGLIVLDFGLNVYGTDFLSKNKTGLVVSNFLSSSILFRVFIFILFAFFSVIYLAFFSDESEFYFVSYLLFNFLMYSFILSFYFVAIQKVKVLLFVNLIPKFIYLCLIFFASNLSLQYVYIAYSVNSALVMFLSLYFMRGIDFTLPSFADVRIVYRKSKPYFIARLSVMLYTSGSMVLLKFFSTPIQVTSYGLSEKLYIAAQGILNSVSTSLFPHNNSGVRTNVGEKIVLIILPFLLFISIFLIYFNAEIITLIYGQKYSGFGEVFVIFVLLGNINFVGVIFGYPSFAYLKRIDIVNKTVYLGAALHFFLLIFIFTLDLFNAYNLALCVLFTEIFVCTLRLFYYFKVKGDV